MRRLIVLLIFTIFSLFLLTAQVAYAADTFLTDYKITYTVREDGNTDVAMNVGLTNSVSDYSYVSSYKVQVGFEHIANVTASDAGGSITPTIEKAESGQMIGLKFNTKVVGVGNKQAFTIRFSTSDIALKQGNIWEINIPGISAKNEFNTFDVDLRVPKSFGTPAYIKPRQIDSVLHFTKDQLKNSGISLAFGDKQIYSFNLSYHLENKNLFPIRTEIALPPDTNYQTVFLQSLQPEPLQVKKDADGNWLAEYELLPSQKKDILAQGKAEISLHPVKEPLDEKQLAPYLQEKPYWQATNAKIQSLAESLKTPEAIYDYVVKTLQYDYTRVTSSANRIGAVGVLQKPSSAVCLEFTDLFVALARASGIPAREVDGYAYTENKRQRPSSLVEDILHAWPEYYDRQKQTWVMVDPTWGNTTGGVDYFNTLDFDHFTFVKKGMSSTYPVPAGGYKSKNDENKKDIIIGFSNDIVGKAVDIQVMPYLQNTYIAGFPVGGRVMIINKGSRVIRNELFTVTATSLFPQRQDISIDELLPFANKELSFRFNKKPFLTNKTYTITMSVAGKEYRKSIRVIPILVQEWKIIGGIGLAILAICILIITFKTRRLRIS